MTTDKAPLTPQGWTKAITRFIRWLLTHDCPHCEIALEAAWSGSYLCPRCGYDDMTWENTMTNKVGVPERVWISATRATVSTKDFASMGDIEFVNADIAKAEKEKAVEEARIAVWDSVHKAIESELGGEMSWPKHEMRIAVMNALEAASKKGK